MSKAVSKLGANKSLSAALLTTVVLTLGISLTGCSGEHEEILAVDRVDQAADIARQLAPEPEDMEFPEVVAAPMPDATATDMTVPADGAEAVATDAPATEDLAVNVGAELYNKQCMACHANGLLNAPKYGDAAAWAPRSSPPHPPRRPSRSWHPWPRRLAASPQCAGRLWLCHHHRARTRRPPHVADPAGAGTAAALLWHRSP